MKTRLLFFLLGFNLFGASQAATLDSLLQILDNEILNSEQYVCIRRNRIGELRNRLMHVSPHQTDTILGYNLQLFEEYKAYNLDSAIYYLDRNIELSGQLGNHDVLSDTRMRLAYILVSSGMYAEAQEHLQQVDPATLTRPLLGDYYLAYDHLYGELGCYTQYKNIQQTFYKRTDACKDSLLNILSPGSEAYLALLENIARSKMDYREAMQLNDRQSEYVKKDTPQYSIWAFLRALNYRGLKDVEQEKCWLAASAISDIRAAVKDHASLWMLADIIGKEGDTRRAHSYIRFSWDEINKYNARLRTLQSSEILSVIDANYQALSKQSADRLRWMLLVISMMAVVLVGGVFYLYRQKKKLSQTRNHLKIVNDQLLFLNAELTDSNTRLDTANLQLTDTNRNLSETNRIKEEYIGRFLSLCSLYIDKLSSFRNLVNKKIAANQIEELYKLTRSREAHDKDLEELYHHFDKAFLHLFPGFVEEFNSLMKDNEQITPQKSELLNTELRIFALIRLGVEDSSRIAEFLHYSPNTIYNYRARVKSKARISRDEFEEVIKRLG